MNTGWWEFDIHGSYSLWKIVFAPICVCKNNRRIWYDVTMPQHGVTYWTVVTSQCHNRKDRSSRKCLDEQLMIILAALCARPGHKIACKKWNNIWVIVITFFATREAIRQWFPVIHTLLYMSCMSCNQCPLYTAFAMVIWKKWISHNNIMARVKYSRVSL